MGQSIQQFVHGGKHSYDECDRKTLCVALTSSEAKNAIPEVIWRDLL